MSYEDAPGQPARKAKPNWLDRRVRALAAGIGWAELRAMLRGDPPTEKPNPRYKAHTESMVLHLRPRYYQYASTWFTHTFRLGFFVTFLFIVEVITGFILMIYYVPTPEGAYESVWRLMTRVPYGELLRDIHRLAAEGMVIFACLHLLRTFLTASYRRERSFTWGTGVMLLLLTLALSFSGYLLPWDQLAYWAVTIGTSMAAAVPLVGQDLNALLRGGEVIGADGLLRFYQLHVLLLPLAAGLLISVHYYRVARKHGISLPARVEEGDVTPQERLAATRRVDYLPGLLAHEVFLVGLGLLLLAVLALFVFDAPLESHANPQRTPLNAESPWFFLWVQGLLKLGDKRLMGVFVPLGIVALLLAVPYVDRNSHRMLRKRPLALALCCVALVTLGILSYAGTANYGITMPAASRISQDLVPEEGSGPLHAVPFDSLPVGIYETNGTDPAALPEEFSSVFTRLERQVNAASAEGELPDAQALLVVEEWQRDLKRVTLRILWSGDLQAERKTFEREIFLHRNRGSYASQ
jgi:quinol-cytochrome oxidoreductase complex cytochrome b subunit